MDKCTIVVLAAGLLLIGSVIVAVEAGVFGTGYSEDQPLSDGQKAELEQIALSDPVVHEQINGHDYTISSGGYSVEESWSPVHGKKVYPLVQIMVPERHTYYNVVIDLHRKAVLSVQPDVLPYMPQELMNSTVST